MASNVDGGDRVDCQGLLCKQGQSWGASNVCVGHFLAARCLFLCRDAFAGVCTRIGCILCWITRVQLQRDKQYLRWIFFLSDGNNPYKGSEQCWWIILRSGSQWSDVAGVEKVLSSSEWTRALLGLANAPRPCFFPSITSINLSCGVHHPSAQELRHRIIPLASRKELRGFWKTPSLRVDCYCNPSITKIVNSDLNLYIYQYVNSVNSIIIIYNPCRRSSWWSGSLLADWPSLPGTLWQNSAFVFLKI